MKKILIIGLKSLALLTIFSWLDQLPVSAQRQQQIQKIVKQTSVDDRDNLDQNHLPLQLTAAIKVIDRDQSGKPIVTWRSLPDKSIAMSGDIIRYTLSSHINSHINETDLIVTQEIPSGTNYIFSSARSRNSATISYSIDGGQNFVEQPLIEVKMSDGSIEKKIAPANTYTHIRWQFEGDDRAEIKVQASYDVKVE